MATTYDEELAAQEAELEKLAKQGTDESGDDPTPEGEEETVAGETETQEAAPEPAQPEPTATDQDLQQWEERYKNAQRKMTEATTEAANLRRDNEGLRSEITEIRGMLFHLKQQNERFQTPAPMAEPDPKDQEFREDYPEVHERFVQRDEKLDETKRSVSNMQAELGKMRVENCRREILLRHPDAMVISQAPEWNQWYESLPPKASADPWEINKDDVASTIGNIYNVESIIKILDKFKSDTGYGRAQVQGGDNGDGTAPAETRAQEAARVAMPMPSNKARKPDLKDKTPSPPTTEEYQRVLQMGSDGLEKMKELEKRHDAAVAAQLKKGGYA